jgi:hypothetical protein
MMKQIMENYGGFDVKNWYREWYLERLRYPACLLIQAEEPVRPGDIVYIIAIARYPYPDASRTTQWSLCLIGERLTKYTAEWISTIISSTNKLQGIDPPEALAFLTQVYLYATDLVRALDGEKSLLVEKPWTPVGQPDEDLRPHLPRLIANPVWQLESLLRFWVLRGQRMRPGALYSPGAPGGRFCAHTIPEIWMSSEELQQYSNPSAERPKIPILVEVEPAMQPLIEPFIAFVQAGSHANLRLSLHRDHPEGSSPKEEQTSTPKAMPAVVRQLSDTRLINWQGQTVRISSQQVSIVLILYEAHRDSLTEVPHDYIMAALERVEGHLKDMLRSRRAFFKTLILQPRPGYYQLHPDFLKACGISVKE